MKIIDITLPISENTPVWEGDPGVKFQKLSSIEEGDEYNVSTVELSLHAGTHIDAPFHVVENGMTIDAISLNKLIGDVQVVQIPAEIKVIDENYLLSIKINPEIPKIIFKTTNSELWSDLSSNFSQDYVALNSSGAKILTSLNLDLVGIDYFSISTFHDLLKPHEILLNSNIVILENLNLSHVEPGLYQLFCLPLKIEGVDGAPVRAILIEE